jgi:hypothetical protein
MERIMNRSMKFAALAVSLFVTTALAQDKKAITVAERDSASQVELGAQVIEIRKSQSETDPEKVSRLDGQVIELQKTVSELQWQLANAPHYLDNPATEGTP